MALKAGRVGVHPSQVDISGKVIGGGVDAYTKAESDAKFATKEALGDYVEVEDYTADLADINLALSGKADAEAVTTALASKADAEAVTTALAAKADTTAVTAALALKADQSNLTANDNNFIFAYDSASQKYGYKAGGADTFHPFSSGGGVFDVEIDPDIFDGHSFTTTETYFSVETTQTPKFIIFTFAAQASTNAPTSYTVFYDVAKEKARLVEYLKSGTAKRSALLSGSSLSDYVHIFTDVGNVRIKNKLAMAGYSTVSIYY